MSGGRHLPRQGRRDLPVARRRSARPHTLGRHRPVRRDRGREAARPWLQPAPAVDRPAERPGRQRLRRIGRALGMAGGGAAFLGVLAIGLFPTQTFLQQRAATAEIEQRLAVLRAQNEAFEARIEALQTDEEIERLAREQYNLAYPGEEAYAVLPAPLPPLDLPPLWPYGEIYDPQMSAGEVHASLEAP